MSSEVKLMSFLQNEAIKKQVEKQVENMDSDKTKKKEKQKSEKVNEQAESQMKESEYLKKLSQLASHDRDLAIAQAQSAELVRQMDSYRAHYEKFEQITHSLIVEYDKKVAAHMKQLLQLAVSLEKSSNSLNENISQEIMRLTAELQKTIEGTLVESCTKELEKVEEAVVVLEDYSEKIKKRYQRFEGIEKLKLALFIMSSLASPIVLVLMLLNYFHII